VDILLVEDHPLFREGFKLILGKLDATIVIHEAGDAKSALQQAAEREYDLVLLDLKLPDVEGIPAVTTLREALPSTPLVVLSAQEHPNLVHEAIKAGAMGFIPKSSTPEVLIPAMRLVLAGGVYLPPAVLEKPMPEPRPSMATLPDLTQRQVDVLRWLVQGKSNKEIARQLGIVEATVKLHVTPILRAFGVEKRSELVYVVAKLGLQLQPSR
jgi:DNA-binding NarL/FixJ family response regulator